MTDEMRRDQERPAYRVRFVVDVMGADPEAAVRQAALAVWGEPQPFVTSVEPIPASWVADTLIDLVNRSV